MDDTAICGRSKEINEISSFIQSKLDTKTSGILYLTGPPGTGKTMSVRYVIDNRIDKNLPSININCLRAQTSRFILSKLCEFVGLDIFTKYNESEMINRLTKKFSGRTSRSHLIVLDEMDQLPKSKNADLIRTIFSWPNLDRSKLILIGIANTVNLTSRYQTISNILGKDISHVSKILFKPYNSSDIKAILQWYLENDENFEDDNIDPKALDLIARRSARGDGDIRGALNALKSATSDFALRAISKKRIKTLEVSDYPTPPATPPTTPCKEKTNIGSVANSIKKRQRLTHYLDDTFPFTHQVILTCIQKLCYTSKTTTVDSKSCFQLASQVLEDYNLSSSFEDYRSMLDNLENQGLISLKKGKPREKVVLRASDAELDNLVKRHDMIMTLLDSKV